MKTGRNDPCPCGSGKKFKKCCQEKLEAPSKNTRSSDIGPLVALFNSGRYEELESQTRLVIEHYPDSGAAWKVLGVALLVQGKEALPELKKAAKLLPDDAEVHNNLGLALAATWQHDEAVQCYKQALKIKPDFAEVYNNLGNALKDTGQIDEAIASYRQAVTLLPSYTQAHSNLIYLLYFHPAFDEAGILAQAKQFTVGQRVTNDSLVEVNNNPKKKLRIGYVSPDFRNHCQSLFTIPLLSNHDHAQFEIYCYAQLTKVDEISLRLAGYADVWRSTNGMSDAQLAEIIAKDGIDILIDLTMHMSYGRPLLFARRAAPVQIAWLAYPGTTGIPAMDYRLTDPWLDPIEFSDDRYTEKTLRLPDTFWCYEPLVEGLEPNELPALTNGYVTFGCLNNFCKVSDDTLFRWGKIMASVPSSRLILLAAPGRHRQRVLDLLGQQGVVAGRVEFVGFQPRPDYLRTYHRIDLCLDTLPYNGHTTSLDAYWMGVPVVTQVGQTIVGRAGWSQLNNLGLPELAAFDEQSFINIAIALATDLSRLNQIRQTLRSCMESSPLMDGKRFARGMESAYRQLWQQASNRELPVLTGRIEGTVPTPDELNQLVVLFNSGCYAELESRTLPYFKQYPNSGAIWKILGASLQAQGKEAFFAMRKATQLLPDDAEAHCNLGVALKELGRGEEAVVSFRRALAIKPDYATAYNNLGNVMCDLGQLDNAVVCCHQALKLEPNFADAHCSLGIALQHIGLLQDAVTSYRRAIEIQPEYAEAHYNLALALLSMGEMTEGWKEHEWRWMTATIVKHRREFSKPQWRGEDARGKTLLIYSEQGYGDTLQFCRYAQLAAARGLRVILEVPPPLLRLLRGLSGVDLLIAEGQPLPNFDLYCPMLSMPFALKTTLAIIPGFASYLQADRAQVDSWRIRLDDLPSKGFRVGLVWAGNPRANFPHLAEVDRRRSIVPELLAPLFNLSGLHFFSLQKGGIAPPENFPLTDFMNEMGDFADTAALIANLDLVISVDTSVAHLAAALGKPVWVLDRFDSCWRWMRERDDSPWYPSLRLFRQPKPGDWEAVIKKVVEELCLLSGDIMPIANTSAINTVKSDDARPRQEPEKLESPLPALKDPANISAPTNIELNQLVDLLRAGCHVELESRTRLLVEQYPDSGLVWKMLGIALQAQGMEALSVLQKAAELLPGDAYTYSYLGAAQKGGGRLGEAVASYRRALEIKPDFAEVHSNLGLVLQDLGQSEEAVASYRHALEIRPDLAVTHNNLGNILRELGQFDEAAAHCRRALELNPDYTGAHSNLGNVPSGKEL